jgi:hypothetical protein
VSSTKRILVSGIPWCITVTGFIRVRREKPEMSILLLIISGEKNGVRNPGVPTGRRTNRILGRDLSPEVHTLKLQ